MQCHTMRDGRDGQGQGRAFFLKLAAHIHVAATSPGHVGIQWDWQYRGARDRWPATLHESDQLNFNCSASSTFEVQHYVLQ